MILPSKFCELANFPDRWQEKDLQHYIGDRLRQRGFSVQLEVKANGGRADIVTNWQGGAVIEVKKYLDRDTIYQASGQLGLYGLNNKYKLIIMGFLTPDANAQTSALKTASMIEQNQRVKVIFVNLEDEWIPGNTHGLTRFNLFNFLTNFNFPNLPNIQLNKFFQLLLAHPLLVIAAILCLSSVILDGSKPSDKVEFTNSTK